MMLTVSLHITIVYDFITDLTTIILTYLPFSEIHLPGFQLFLHSH